LFRSGSEPNEKPKGWFGEIQVEMVQLEKPGSPFHQLYPSLPVLPFGLMPAGKTPAGSDKTLVFPGIPKELGFLKLIVWATR